MYLGLNVSKERGSQLHLPFLHFKGERIKCLSFNLEWSPCQEWNIILRLTMFLWWICRKDEGMRDRLDFETCLKDLGEEIRNRLDLNEDGIGHWNVLGVLISSFNSVERRSDARYRFFTCVQMTGAYIITICFSEVLHWSLVQIPVGTHENYTFHYLSEF